MIKVVDIIHRIVASMRAVNGAITSITELDGISTVTSANTLEVNELVTIGVIEYRVLSADATKFTVTATGLTDTTWSARDPYFEVGHLVEINERLTEKDLDKKLKFQKYPLIVFFTDVTINRGDKFYYGELKGHNISILNDTVETYSTKQRYAENIYPILAPLYDELVNKIQKSNRFNEVYPNLKHVAIERPFWGVTTKYGNKANFVSDPLDAIELTNISLKLKKFNCNT